MKGMLVYDTSYGNTRTIAQSISETLNESGIEVDLFQVKDAKKLSSKDYDFLIVGSPTRFGTMSLAIRRFLGTLTTEGWEKKPFAAFDTENPENIEKKQGSAGEKIAEKLNQRNMIEVSPVLKAEVIGMKGPLGAHEIDRTRDYAKALALRLKEQSHSDHGQTGLA